MRRGARWKGVLAGAALAILCACRVGPTYKRPATPVPPAFKEVPPAVFKEAEAAGWKQSQPGDAYLKGKWWEVYGDPALNALEEQVSLNNQNLAQAEAQYREAKAAVRVARSALFPIASAGPSVTASRAGGAAGAGSNAGATGSNVSGSNSSAVRTIYSFPLSASWEPDLWGSIRRGVTASAATAQSFAAALENARLLFQSELAQDYFQLHGIDGEIDLLNRTVASYQDYLKLTRDRLNAGVDSDLDVAQAESQLYGAQASLSDLQGPRAQLEHAIAILVGKAPAEVTVRPLILNTAPPPVPVGIPSELLERRPDIAQAERQVHAANEEIGIAMAAFYPNLTISGSAGFEASTLAKWFSLPSRFWSVGAQLAETLFDAGRRRGIVAGQQAAYDATVAAYRETVLTAFGQVEDSLAALRTMEEEAGHVQHEEQASQRALDLSTAQYRSGTVSYLTVIVSQTALLGTQRNAINLLARRLTASAQLIEALGGGWNSSKLPTQKDVSSK